MWVEEFKPIRLKEIIGQERAIAELKENIIRRRPVILFGPTGTGKTSSVYALARELDYDVIEMNASDLRNRANIEGNMKNALTQQSLFNRGRIILIDEVDSLCGKDRGGAAAISGIIKDSSFPVVFTANNPYEDKIRSLRNKTKLIEYKAVNYLTIIKKLKQILEKYKIKYDEDILRSIALRSGGDVRGAINDLEALSNNLKSLDGVSEREKTKTIFNILKLIFKSKRANSVLGILMNSDVDLDEFCLWLDENIPKEYYGKDLIGAYEKLSRADVFKGRIRRWQHWRFLVYVDALMTAGVTASKVKKELGFVGYKRSSRLFKRWVINRKNAMKYEIAKKLSKKMHMGSRKIVKEMIPYLSLMMRNRKELDMGLSEEEKDYLNEN